MKKSFLLIVSLFVITLILQVDVMAQGKKYIPDAVIDKEYGITMFEPLNLMLGNDTVRNDIKGYAANGYQTDYYTTGQVLHKGFYVEGQLKVYKNYYPNGNVERNFRMVDIKKAKMTLFFEDGGMKSNIVYVDGEALKWEDYHPNGLLEFVEEYHKSFQYYIQKSNYYESGDPEDVMELTNKKKLIYTQTFYYPNGQVKEVGEIKYNKAEFDYQKIGVWNFYNDSGKPTKTQKYANGALHSEKNL
jgi:antitoxin component YwqK of YwqJK toxin-antitoxin module